MLIRKEKAKDDLIMILQWIDNQTDVIDIKEFTNWLIDYDLLKVYTLYYFTIAEYIGYHNKNISPVEKVTSLGR